MCVYTIKTHLYVDIHIFNVYNGYRIEEAQGPRFLKPNAVTKGKSCGGKARYRGSDVAKMDFRSQSRSCPPYPQGSSSCPSRDRAFSSRRHDSDAHKLTSRVREGTREQQFLSPSDRKEISFMAIFKRGKFYSYEFVFQGQRIRESAHTRSKTLAERAERNRRPTARASPSPVRSPAREHSLHPVRP